MLLAVLPEDELVVFCWSSVPAGEATRPMSALSVEQSTGRGTATFEERRKGREGSPPQEESVRPELVLLELLVVVVVVTSTGMGGAKPPTGTALKTRVEPTAADDGLPIATGGDTTDGGEDAFATVAGNSREWFATEGKSR